MKTSAIFVYAVVVLTLVWMVRAEVIKLGELVTTNIERVEAMPDAVPDSHATTWKSAGPLTHTVTTPRKDGETDTAWAARHAASVAALKAQFQPIP